jgi:hypothetical protein
VSAEADADVAADGSGALLNEDGSLPEINWKGKQPAVKKEVARGDPAAAIIPAAVLVRVRAEGVNNECPICLDLITRHGAIVTPCGHAFCKVCLDTYSGDKGHVGVECPMCRNPISVAKTVAALHVRGPPSPCCTTRVAPLDTVSVCIKRMDSQIFIDLCMVHR